MIFHYTGVLRNDPSDRLTRNFSVFKLLKRKPSTSRLSPAPYRSLRTQLSLVIYPLFIYFRFIFLRVKFFQLSQFNAIFDPLLNQEISRNKMFHARISIACYSFISMLHKYANFSRNSEYKL